MTHNQRHQLVLDAAWTWLCKNCDWFDRRAVADERHAQLRQWNNFPRIPFSEGDQ